MKEGFSLPAQEEPKKLEARRGMSRRRFLKGAAAAGALMLERPARALEIEPGDSYHDGLKKAFEGVGEDIEYGMIHLSIPTKKQGWWVSEDRRPWGESRQKGFIRGTRRSLERKVFLWLPAFRSAAREKEQVVLRSLHTHPDETSDVNKRMRAWEERHAMSGGIRPAPPTFTKPIEMPPSATDLELPSQRKSEAVSKLLGIDADLASRLTYVDEVASRESLWRFQAVTKEEAARALKVLEQKAEKGSEGMFDLFQNLIKRIPVMNVVEMLAPEGGEWRDLVLRDLRERGETYIRSELLKKRIKTGIHGKSYFKRLKPHTTPSEWDRIAVYTRDALPWYGQEEYLFGGLRLFPYEYSATQLSFAKHQEEEKSRDDDEWKVGEAILQIAALHLKHPAILMRLSHKEALAEKEPATRIELPR